MAPLNVAVRGALHVTDVLIIGARPAARRLAHCWLAGGYAVLVLERQKFPRFSIGESLLANSMQFIEEAGMLDVLAGGSTALLFVRDGEYSDYNFSQKSAAGYSYTFQVPRADFDKVLAAKRRGRASRSATKWKSTRR